MAEPKSVYPFSAFNFDVQIEVKGLDVKRVCDGQFAECDGLEMTMDVKTIREGGNNVSQIRLIGGVNYGQVTLKRGMTANSVDLWDWFDAQQLGTPAQLRKDMRGEATIVLKSPNREKERVKFILRKCLLTKLKAPALNAKDGIIAIEELQLTYESMSIERGGGLADA
ncbi:MAG TPA: phage tail protein [Thermoanaerobaculia bacterium]|nr:phage tail protein [Thermoanaerobaculia bacterium]